MPLADTTFALDEALDATCKNSRILIVEDDPHYRFFLKQTLTKQGYSNIEQAANGNEGYYKTISFKPHLVVLDLMMPICNGIEYCERVRAHAEFADMPILVQTGVGDTEMHHKSFTAGATDLLTKPVNQEEFLARTQAHLERYELSRNLQSYRNVLKQEMDVADSMQRYFMPNSRYTRDIEQRFGLLITSHYQSSGIIGGDMWNAIPLDANRLLIYACDFSGQGISSAMQSMRYHMLMQHIAEEYDDPGAALTALNTRVQEMLKDGQHTLMFLAICDKKNDTLSYASAGYPSPMLINIAQNRMQRLQGDEPALGMGVSSAYTSFSTPFHEADSLFVHSDALLSTLRADGTHMSLEHLEEMANDCLMNTSSLQEAHKAFLSCLCFNIEAANATLADDLLLLLVSRN